MPEDPTLRPPFLTWSDKPMKHLSKPNKNGIRPEYLVGDVHGCKAQRDRHRKTEAGDRVISVNRQNKAKTKLLRMAKNKNNVFHFSCGSDTLEAQSGNMKDGRGRNH